MAASTKKTGKRGILRLTGVFRENPAEAPSSPPSSESASDMADIPPAKPVTNTIPASAATPETAPQGDAEFDPADDTIEGLRRLSTTSPAAGAEIGPEERAAAVRRIEDEIHQRLARWLRLEDELRTSAREIQRLEAANDASRVAIGALESQVTALGTERDAALANAGRLQAEVEVARQKSSAADAERSQALERQLAQVREEESRHLRLRTEAEGRADALRAELVAHRDALAGLQASLGDMQALVDAGESQKAALAGRAQELERALADARNQQQADKKAQAELSVSLAELRKASQVAEEARTRAAGQERDLANLRGQVSRLERHNAELITELEATRTGLEAQLKESNAALARQLAEAETGREAATAGLATAEATLAAVAGERDALLESLAERDSRLAQRAREIEALEQAGAQLVVERDAQVRTIQELHAQLRTHKKLVRVLGNGMGGVNEVAATIRSLDDWVSHQLDEGAVAEAASEMSPPDLRCGRALEALGGPKSTRYPVEKNIFTIGRSAESDMRVGGPYTSRHHARILNEGTEAIIEDLGSANGLLVNDARVARCVLHDGDVVDIGGSRFRFLDRPGPGNAVRLS